MPDENAALEAESVPTAADYENIAKRLKDGYVVPFFGAGASFGCGGLPSTQELALHIAEQANFPDPDERKNLALVASYLAHVASDSLGLDALLRKIFDVQAEETALHRCIASVENLRLVVTTNYDDLIERALVSNWVKANTEASKPWIVVDRGEYGTVWYRQPGTPLAKAEANKLRDVLVNPEPAPGQPTRRRPILFKMHGSLDRDDRDQDWFLITEEHYVDFLGRPENGQIPPLLFNMMSNSNLLFLGYGLHDWNVRVLLRKMMLSRSRARPVNCWAVVKSATQAEKRLWRAHDVRIFEIDLQTFAGELQARL